MAEAIGLVASVIQVAGAGLKLSQSLYQYVDGVATADRRIKDIAKEIELTSFVIEELGSVFEQDETSNLISKTAVKTANATMKECLSVFGDIDATLKKSKKNTLGRLMLPFRDNKIELLRNHIDKLKTTLQLLMQVLTHAHQVASKKLDREAEAQQREEIRQLLENKNMSTKKYEESLQNYSISDVSTMIDDEQGINKENADPVLTDGAATALAIGSTINHDTLGECILHIRGLLKDVETLRQALVTQVSGDDHSDHHQNLIGSYFRARSHLDRVLLGSSQTLDNSNSATGGHRTAYSASVGEVEIGIEKTTRSSIPDRKISRSKDMRDAEPEKREKKIDREKTGKEPMYYDPRKTQVKPARHLPNKDEKKGKKKKSDRTAVAEKITSIPAKEVAEKSPQSARSAVNAPVEYVIVERPESSRRATTVPRRTVTVVPTSKLPSDSARTNMYSRPLTLPPPPQGKSETRNTDATYIPSRNPFGPGVGVPQLENTDETFGSISRSLPYSYVYSKTGPPSDLDAEEEEDGLSNEGISGRAAAQEPGESDEVDELLREWTHVLG